VSDDILTVEQAAELLGVRPKTVRALAAGGVIPAVKVGKPWRFDETLLREWIAEFLKPETAPPEYVQQFAEVVSLGYRTPPPLPRTPTRRDRIARATPVWADLAAIDAIYARRRRETLRTGIPHHVDHIVPIDGRTVSGLHVHGNLRVIPARDNVRRPRIWVGE
jgi:excisionase family DNA binding protein